MSSLAATQADGYYAPPEYYESGQYKKKSISQFTGSKGHNQYLRKSVVRFELPYSGLCLLCGHYVGKGTRFNAQKSKIGAYFSSPIYRFVMTCRACGKAEFVIDTNPKEQSFDYVEGIHKQVQEFDTKEAGTTGVVDTEYGNKLISANGSASQDEGNDHALSHLEQVASGARKSMTERDQLEHLMTINQRTMLNDSASNAAIRSSFRVDRNKKKRRLHEAKTMGWKQGMELLTDDTDDDVIASRTTCFGKGKDRERAKFRRLRKSSIFDQSSMNRRKSRKQSSLRDDHRSVRPDNVHSSSSSRKTTTKGSKATNVMVIQHDDAERKRIRLVSGASGLEREKETPASASLSSLLADYGSDDTRD